MTVYLQQNEFDIGKCLTEVRCGEAGNSGAVAVFVGYVRDITSDGHRLIELEIEHYRAMALRQIRKIEAEACQRWRLNACLIGHRYGRLAPEDQIVVVMTAASHRQEAFTAVQYIMDFLKSTAPFWKKERYEHGSSWVASKADDMKALERW